MRSRSTILLTLLIFRIFFIPVWYSCNVHQFNDPASTFEHIRIHKRRSWLIEEKATAEAIQFEEQQQQRIIPLIRLIAKLFFSVRAITQKVSSPFTVSDGPLFLRHRVLRI
ncbi:hypothetical protein ACE38W_11465 [Chitinophaga sp. Hz27]|uniref:hypothetical protein n=1 Tax=Chitinophaga sp. Hz27 TaxID=3347169 RepID=UPI0035E13452